MIIRWTAGTKDTPDYGLCEVGRELEVNEDQGTELISRGLAKEITTTISTTEDKES